MPGNDVHICGHSVVGKQTLIRKPMTTDPPDLRGRFGVTGPVQSHGGMGKEAHPIDAIKFASADTILHFWQDNTHPRIGPPSIMSESKPRLASMRPSSSWYGDLGR